MRAHSASRAPVATIAIAVVIPIFQLSTTACCQGVIGAALWFLLGIVYFAAVGRHGLVRSPEEEFAMRQAGNR